MRSVLCYGDSNTHGQIPGGTPLDRYRPSERWPGIMAKELGHGWHVIEEGLSGRTTVRDDPIEELTRTDAPTSHPVCKAMRYSTW